MLCKLCGNMKWVTIKHYNRPDKYESWCGIGTPMARQWMRCFYCGFYQARRSYPLSQLDKIYTDGYRNKDFRDETIDETFNRIASLPHGESENSYRVNWMRERIEPAKWVLDIGSGFGIFPYTLKHLGYMVHCVEPNEESAEFIKNRLCMECYEGFFPMAEIQANRYDLVSMVHVLEHAENPDLFLGDAVLPLKDGGKVFIEVPDAVEFSYLPNDHDEFNSCHTSFFDVRSLCDLLDICKLNLTDVHRIRHKTRNLSRIMVIAEKKC